MKISKVFSLSVIFIIFLSNVYAAPSVSHNASQVTSGFFDPGDFTFQGNLEQTRSGEVSHYLRNTQAGGRRYALVSAGSPGGIGLGKFSIYDATAGVSRLAIDTAGNVGIGSTTPPYKLYVVGDAGWTGSLLTGSVPWARLTTFPGACPAGQYVTAVGGTLTCAASSAGQYDNINWVSSSRLDNSGNPIGTSIISPVPNGWTTSAIQAWIRGLADAYRWRMIWTHGRLLPNQNPIGGSWDGRPCSSNPPPCYYYSETYGTDNPIGGAISGSGTANYVSKFTGATSLGNSVIFDNGNVGIGTITPAEKLDVIGNIHLSGALKSGNLNSINNAASLWALNNEGAVFAGFSDGRAIGIGKNTISEIGMAVSQGVTPQMAVYYTPITNEVRIKAYTGVNGIGFITNPGSGDITRLFIRNTGNIGIGTSAPLDPLGWGSALDVAGGLTASRYHDRQNTGYYADLDVGGNLGGAWTIGGDLTTNSNLILGGTNRWILHTPDDGRSQFYFGYWTGSTWTWPYEFQSNGNLNVNDVWLRSIGRWASSFSDIRLKENVKPLTNVLDRLQNVRGVSFDWNELYDSLGHPNDKRQIGVIAQELEAQFPELVTDAGNESYKSVNYEGLTAVLIEAVKELKAENEELKQRVEALEHK